MSDRITGDTYVPLPKKLPKKDDKTKSQRQGDRNQETDSSQEYDVEIRSPRRADVKIIHVESPDDDEVHPRIERTTPPSHSQSRRDSGKFMMDSRPDPTSTILADAIDAAEYERRRRETETELLTKRFNQALAQERVDKEKAEAESEALKRRLEDEARLRNLRERAQNLREREQRLKETETREAEEARAIRSPPAPREVVIVNTRPANNPPAQGTDRGANAHNRARDDYRRRTAGRGETRDDRQVHPRERRRNVTIIEDEGGRRPDNRW